MDNNHVHNEGLRNEIKNEVKGRGLFYGVIAVATFIVMAVGATFAYFTATTNSTNTSVQTGSTTLKLQYISYEGAWMNDDLIPAAPEVVAWSFENQDDTTLSKEEGIVNGNLLCKDDYGNSICSVYVFQVKNSAASPQSVSLNVVSELNEFANLSAMAYEISVDDSSIYDEIGEAGNEENGTVGNGLNDPKFRMSEDDDIEGDTFISILDGDGKNIFVSKENIVFVNRKGVAKNVLKYTETNGAEGSSSVPAQKAKLKQVLDASTNTNDNIEERTTKVANNFEIEGGETKTYALVLYIADTGTDQTEVDADKEFQGQVVISSGDGSTGVSGYIKAYVDANKESEPLPNS